MVVYPMNDTNQLIVQLSFLVIALSIPEWINTIHNKTYHLISRIHFFAAQLCDDLILGRSVKLISGEEIFNGSFGTSFDMTGTNNVTAIMVDLEKERNLAFIHIFVRRTFSGQKPFTDAIFRFLHTALI